MSINRLFLTVVTAVVFVLPIHSASLLFDNADAPLTVTTRTSSLEGVATYLQNGPSSSVTLNQIAINAQPLQDGQLKFVIFSDTVPPGSDAGTLLFSDTVPVSASSSLKYILSDPFSFSLQPGQYYDIGAIFSGSSIRYTYDLVSDQENQITSIVSNENVDNFAAPTLAGHGAADTTIRLYGTASVVPEPATSMLCGFGFMVSGLMMLYRRRQA